MRRQEEIRDDRWLEQRVKSFDQTVFAREASGSLEWEPVGGVAIISSENQVAGSERAHQTPCTRIKNNKKSGQNRLREIKARKAAYLEMESSAPKDEAIGLVLEKHVTFAARESVDHLWVR